MGQEIVYCARCLQRLTGGDFEKGKAKRLGSRVACLECYPHVLAGLDPEERARLEEPAPASPPSSRRLPPRAPSTTSLRAPSSPPPRNPLPWILAGAAAVVAVGGLVLTSRSSPGPNPPAPPRPPTAVVRPPAPPALPPEDAAALRAARQALADAEALRASKPDDLDAQVAAFEEAVRRADKTTLYPDAVRAYDAAVAARKQRRAREAESLERQVKDAATRGDLRTGRDACVRAASQPELATLAARLEQSLRARAEELVADAAAGGADRAAFRAKVESWGWPDLVALLDRTAETRPWRPLFQGNLDFMMDFFKGKWTVAGGVLTPVDSGFSGKTREEFGDCEVRFRLEFEDASNLFIRVRQNGTGHFGLEWSRRELDSLRKRELDIVIRVQGDRLEVTLDGRPMPSDRHGAPARGPIQFGGVGRGVRVRAIEVRP